MKPFSKLAALAFSVVCAAHVVRLGMKWTVTVDGFTVPMWLSVMGAIATGVLATMVWRESRSH